MTFKPREFRVGKLYKYSSSLRFAEGSVTPL